MINDPVISARTSVPEVVAEDLDLARTSPVRHASVHRFARAALFTAALALTASQFAYPAIARADYDKQQYEWCMENVGRGIDYCCQQAGGVVSSNGDCVDPASIYTPAPPATVTTRRSPDIGR